MLFEDLTCGLLWLFIFAAPFELRLSVGGISVPGLVGYGSIAVGLLGLLWSKKLTKPSLGFVFLLAFCLWSTISIAWSDYSQQTTTKILIYWGLLGFVALLTQYASNAEIRLRMLTAYVAGCWCGVASLLFSYVSGTQYMGMSGRYSSAFGDPNFLALALAIGVPIACYKAAREDVSWKRVLYLAYAPAAIGAIAVTGSRGGALSLVAATVAFGALSMHKVHKIRVTWLIGALGICIGVVYFLPPDVMARLATIPSELQSGTLSGRRTYWDAAAPLVEEHPLQGLGAGGGDAAVSSILGIVKVVHSTPLEIILDGGAIGLLLFYGALLCGLYSAWQCEYAERCVLFAASAAWFVGTFSLSWEDHKVTWFVLGLLVSTVPLKWPAKSRVATLSSGRYPQNRMANAPVTHQATSRSTGRLGLTDLISRSR